MRTFPAYFARSFAISRLAISPVPLVHVGSPPLEIPAEGWAFRFRVPASMAILIGFGVTTLFSHPRAILHGTWTSLGLDALAWLAFLTGFVIRLWATLYIGGRKRHVLVCEGPYSVCRNPLYVGTFLTWISMVFFFQSATFALGVGLAMLLFARCTVPAEEARLRMTLGHTYEEYCRTVPRFWPRWSQFRTSATVPVHVAGLWQEFRRASRWLWAPIMAEAFLYLRTESWWPHWFWLP